MKLYVFSIRDRAIASFDRPMFMVSKGQCMRSFQDEVNRVASDNMINLHPGDYELWALGEFDADTGRFVCGEPELLVVAKDLLITKG